MSDYRQIVEEKRQAMLNILLESIEKDPARWEKGWYSIDVPFNGATLKDYNGINALFLDAVGRRNGYTDPRWVTFNQAKDLKATVKAGAKASEVFFWSKYDTATKKPFDNKTVEGMSDEEKLKYLQENVKPVLKFYQVFNAEQCNKFPENTRKKTMTETERANQNTQIEIVIHNSDAPVIYDGGDRAYYRPSTDDIHLPQIGSFKSMNDYYATALHEIGHSTGHEKRLNREMGGAFGTSSYAIEELRAELSSVFMQTELGLKLEGAEIANHGAYLKSWLEAVKQDSSIFFKAASDAGKISDFVKERYIEAQNIRQSIQEAKTLAQEADIPFVDTTFDDSEFNPAVYDGRMSVSDYKRASANETKGQENKKEQEYFIKSQIPGWSDWSTATLPKEVREAAEWLIKNGLENDNAAIKRVAEKYQKKVASENTTENAKNIHYYAVKEEEIGIYPDYQNMQSIYIIEDGSVSYHSSHSLNENIAGEISWGQIQLPYSRTEPYWNYEQVSFAELEKIAESEKNKLSIKSSLAPKIADNIVKNDERVNSEEDEIKVEFAPSSAAPLTATEVATPAVVNQVSPLTESPAPKQASSGVSAWLTGKREKRYTSLEKNVPAEMKALPNWCAFNSVKAEDGDYKKKIWNCNASTEAKEWAKCNDPSTWTTFDKALEYARKNACDGLSFALTKESRIFCIDLDDCKSDGKYSPLAWGVVNAAKGTYVERSVSGSGLHLFGKKTGDVDFNELGNKNKEGTLEFYDESRFISMTGDIFVKAESVLKPFSSADKLLVATKEQLPVKTQIRPSAAFTNNESDSAVIERIRRSKKADEFNRLFMGEDICKDPSRSDFKMLNILAFFTNGDAAQMRRIFEQSGLMREDKSSKYLDYSINRAVGTLCQQPTHVGTSAPQKNSKEQMRLPGLA